ncbi:DUF3800 domain-containing protein [Enterococcus plantarum]|uniref:DUF3800 domain-containing protein n=1 Tax=Enterococcus plantarum TaxID=1077675 RepID=UPI001A8CD65B|nr:DUF3800 domain-containing protein [Enterococcus plantarum]MBO0423870.1 DUF3800 domain-containing protein [Enterococcus plantarum]
MIKGGKYLLYLDECIFTDKNTRNKIYGIAGVAVHESQLYSMRKSLGDLKVKLWGTERKYGAAKNIILHSSEIRKAVVTNIPEYDIFKKKENIRKVFTGIDSIIEAQKLVVFGTVVDLNLLELKYKVAKGSSNYRGDSICLTEIINNYACFLKWHNATGHIVFESRASKSGAIADDKFRKQFYKIMTHGTTIYKGLDLQNTIIGMEFIKKQENEAGLQIADFTVQPFLMNFCGEKQTKPSIYRTLKKHRYSGAESFGEKDSKIFGVKYIK